jgi:hypothetical protein
MSRDLFTRLELIVDWAIAPLTIEDVSRLCVRFSIAESPNHTIDNAFY